MHWPDNARAAISLSYDDGLPDNLDRAIPDLNKRKIRGTFYLTTGKRYVQRRRCDWRRAFEQGHEIGSHTVRHPCRADAFPRAPRWLPPELRLENWFPEQIASEIDEASEWLNENIGSDAWRTFAHPCCTTAIGNPPDEDSYDNAIKRHHFAARSGTGEPNDPQSVDLMRIRSFICHNPLSREIMNYCDIALWRGGWAVLMFHSIGFRRMGTARFVHSRLLDHLVDSDFWIAPIRDVARHILLSRQATSGLGLRAT